MRTALGTYSSRKIEQRMCSAARDIRDWREGNTQVKADTNQCTGLPVARVYLFGKHIANVNQTGHESYSVQVVEDTLYQWPTVTTISRLRALGADITVKKGVLYLNGHDFCYTR